MGQVHNFWIKQCTHAAFCVLSEVSSWLLYKVSKTYFDMRNSNWKIGMKKTVMCFQDSPFWPWKIIFPIFLSWLLGWGRRKKSWCRTNINIVFRSTYREFHDILMLLLNILRATFLITDWWLRFLSHLPTRYMFSSDTCVRTEIKKQKIWTSEIPTFFPKRKGAFLSSTYTHGLHFRI